MAEKKTCCFLITCIIGLIIILIIVLIATSMHVLETAEMGLLYLKTSQSIVETKLYTQGTQFTKPFSKFISTYIVYF